MHCSRHQKTQQRGVLVLLSHVERDAVADLGRQRGPGVRRRGGAGRQARQQVIEGGLVVLVTDDGRHLLRRVVRLRFVGIGFNRSAEPL